jgi:two-component system, NtrC family, sensor kinase
MNADHEHLEAGIGRHDGFWKALNEQVQKNEEATEALRRADQKYRSIFEHAIEGIFQTTPDGHYLSANPALARMYGYGEFYGQERLLAAVRDRMRLPAGELFYEVLAEVPERRVWREFEDDVCLVGMEVTRTGMVDASRRVA